MMTIDSSTGAISITRGDTAVITLTFTGSGLTGAKALVTMKRSTEDTTPLWEKKYSITNSYCRLVLLTDDTDFEPGEYVWDVRVLFSGGDVETPKAAASFTILEVVGNA